MVRGHLERHAVAPLVPGVHFCGHCGRPAPTTPPVLTCIHCGQPLPADVNFCSFCGKELIEAVRPEADAEPEEGEQQK